MNAPMDTRELTRLGDVSAGLKDAAAEAQYIGQYLKSLGELSAVQTRASREIVERLSNAQTAAASSITESLGKAQPAD